MNNTVRIGPWDVILGFVTSGFWIVLIWAWPDLAITDQDEAS